MNPPLASLAGSPLPLGPGLLAFQQEQEAARRKPDANSKSASRSPGKATNAGQSLSHADDKRPPESPPSFDRKRHGPPRSGSESFAAEENDEWDDDLEFLEDVDSPDSAPTENVSRGAWLGKGPPPWETDAESDAAAEREYQRVAELVEKGDVRTLLGEILDADSPFASFAPMFDDLAAAARRRASQDLQGLVDDSLAEAQAVLSVVLLRSALILQRRLKLHDRGRYGSPDHWLPAEIQDVGVAGVLNLATRLAELEQLRAATARQRRLAESPRAIRRELNPTCGKRLDKKLIPAAKPERRGQPKKDRRHD